MAATLNDVIRWEEYAFENGYEYILSVCDTFDHDDYPVYCVDAVELEKQKEHYRNAPMQRINEVLVV